MKHNSRAITLMELLIAAFLISVIALAIGNIEIFSRYHVTASERRAKLQNEISFTLDHMNKNITNAIGTILSPAVIREANGVRVRVDSNGNGQIDATDRWIAYRHFNLGAQDSEIRFYNNITASPGSYEKISNKILQGAQGFEILGIFNAANQLNDSFLEVKIIGRWISSDPPSQDNPEITMRTRIHMPSVSIH